MSRLLLIRHGRTEGPLHDRDRIGETGRAEAVRTALALAAAGLEVTHAFTGPAHRHRQTFDAMAPHLAGPGPAHLATVATLDEYDAPGIFDHLLPRWLEARGESMPAPGTPVALDRRAYAVLEGVGTAWATGGLDDPRVESWAAFQSRCVRGLHEMLERSGRGSSALCTTSAGTIAAITGHVLGLDAARAFSLSLAVRNASVTELRFSGDRVSLFSFNELPPHTRPAAP